MFYYLIRVCARTGLVECSYHLLMPLIPILRYEMSLHCIFAFVYRIMLSCINEGIIDINTLQKKKISPSRPCFIKPFYIRE